MFSSLYNAAVVMYYRYGMTSCPYDCEVFDSSLPLFVSQSALTPGTSYAQATSQKPLPKEEVVSLSYNQSLDFTAAFII